MSQRLLLRLGFLLPPVPRKLPDHTLSPELTVELWVQTFTAPIDIETFATLPAKTSLMFLANADRLSLRMISTFHDLRQPVRTSSSFAQF